MSKEKLSLGQIHISNDVLADMAGFATLECYGVVGMASPGLKAGVAQLLTRDRLKRGIRITPTNGEIKVDLYVIIEYGVNLSEVAHNLVNQVKYTLEKFAGVKVANVEVHVQGVRDKREKGK
jgi:uncharacterized alkaline shock family protein YloU